MYPYTQCPTCLWDLRICNIACLLSKLIDLRLHTMASLVHFGVSTGDTLAAPRIHFCFKEER